MNLLYFVVGETTIYHLQCYFSILSFLAHKHIDGVYVYTDMPKIYERLGDKVHIEKVDKDKVREWSGKYDYFFRVKIKLLEDFAEKYPQLPFIYLDADTFLYTSSQALQEGLYSNKIAFMHKNEGELTAQRHTSQKIWKRIKGKTFGGVTFDDKAYNMWNAGLLALPVEGRQDMIKQVLAICDEMFEAGIRYWLVEQFSWGVVLSRYYDLQPAENMVGHYWGNKSGWSDLIMDFFMKSWFRNSNTDDILQQLRTFDFNQRPIYVKVSNTRLRITSLVNKLFKDKNVRYLK